MKEWDYAEIIRKSRRYLHPAWTTKLGATLAGSLTSSSDIIHVYLITLAGARSQAFLPCTLIAYNRISLCLLRMLQIFLEFGIYVIVVTRNIMICITALSSILANSYHAKLLYTRCSKPLTSRPQILIILTINKHFIWKNSILS